MRCFFWQSNKNPKKNTSRRCYKYNMRNNQKITDFGSVSMETVMDTTTRVFASVTVLGTVFGLLLNTYKGIGANILSLQTAGDTAIQKATEYINGQP
ncbi:MAG: hypothetical protein OI715_00155 (plasmid) [Candidatus Methanoperedens sp.]|nr:MAG: hypothetical protein OI715_00155 [Candidatus Methanoperedens sp.]